eukprot:ctg_1531.g510
MPDATVTSVFRGDECLRNQISFHYGTATTVTESAGRIVPALRVPTTGRVRIHSPRRRHSGTATTGASPGPAVTRHRGAAATTSGVPLSRRAGRGGRRVGVRGRRVDRRARGPSADPGRHRHATRR